MADDPDRAPAASEPTADDGASVSAEAVDDVPAPNNQHGAGHHHSHRHYGRRRRRLTWRVYKRRRRVVWAVVIAAGCIVLAAAWVGFRLWQAHDHLEATAGLVSELQQNLKDGDAGAAHQTLVKLQDEAGAAHSEAHDFLWSTAEHLPGIGPNLQAVRIIADSVDDLCWQTLPPLVDVASSLNPAKLAPKGGAIDVSALQKAAPEILQATKAIHALQATVDGIDPKHLISPIAQAVGEMHAKLGAVDRLAGTASRAAQLLPPMLGADGKRTYLVMFQNLAELRATGGMMGAYAVVSADHGRITLDHQGSTGPYFRKFQPPVEQLSSEEQSLYTDRPAIFPADVNLTPDFPTAAKLIRKMYQQRSGTQVDGVIATDPVALAQVLKGTGPVTLPNGYRLTASNAVRYLLSEVYLDTETVNGHRDVFQEALSPVFAALVSGQGSAKARMQGLERAAAQHRLLVWSSHDSEERLLTGTVLAGQLPNEDGENPTVGVFLNDGTGAKMDYYLREKVTLQAAGCRSDGRMVMHLIVVLTSKSPSSGLPESVTGIAAAGAYISRTNVMVFSPTRGAVQSVMEGGTTVPIGSGSEHGRSVGIVTVNIAPGQTKTIQATLLSGPLPASGATGMNLRVTPMSTPAEIEIGPLRVCGAKLSSLRSSAAATSGPA